MWKNVHLYDTMNSVSIQKTLKTPSPSTEMTQGVHPFSIFWFFQKPNGENTGCSVLTGGGGLTQPLFIRKPRKDPLRVAWPLWEKRWRYPNLRWGEGHNMRIEKDPWDFCIFTYMNEVDFYGK